MTQARSQSDWRLVHGIVFVLCMGGVLFVPLLRRWPWVWLVPLGAYLLLVACLPRLRGSLTWFRFGRLSAAAVGATIGIMVLTSLVLVVFHITAQPDVRRYHAVLPLHALGGVVLAGVVFIIVNATLEELVFRGVLFDAIQSQWGVLGTLTSTAVIFGLGHLHGYPPGLLGVCLASLFGFVIGALRFWTGGLAFLL